MGPGTPGPQQIGSGQSVTALQLELIAGAEDISVEQIDAYESGTATVGAIRTYHDLNGNGVVDQGEPEIEPQPFRRSQIFCKSKSKQKKITKKRH